MREHSLVTLFKDFAEPIATSLGLEVWGVRVARGKTVQVQFFIDKTEGAGIEDCTNFSRALSAELDILEDDSSPFAQLASLDAYTLEVSTPGVERSFFSIRQVDSYIGKKVFILVEKPLPNIPNRRKYEGIINAVEENTIILQLQDSSGNTTEECIFPWDNIERIHLVCFEKTA